MRDLAENLGILVTHRPLARPAGTYDTRANGVHNTAGEIDLADYNYPRRILVVVTLGKADKWPPFIQTTLSVRIRSGNKSGALTTVDKILPLIFTPGEQIYEYETVRRYVNVRCVVTNIVSLYVTFAVVLVPDHARYGSMGSDD